LTRFEQATVHHQEEFCTSSLQYFTMHLNRSLVATELLLMMNSCLFKTCLG